MKRLPYLIGLCLLFHVPAWCQVQEQLSPTEKKYLSVVTEPLTLYKGFLRVGFTSAYGVIDKIFQEDGSRESIQGNIIGNSWGMSAFVRYGVTDQLEVEVSVPYRIESIYQTVKFELPGIDTAFVQQWNTRSNSFGDIDLLVSYRFLQETERRPAAGVFIAATIPTAEKNPTNIDPENPGNYTKPNGYGEVSVLTQLKLRKINFPFSYNLFLGYKTYFGGTRLLDPEDTEERPFKSGNYMNAAASFNTHLNNWIVFKNFLDVTFKQPDEEDGVLGQRSWVLFYYPGLSFQIKRFRLDQTILLPVMGKLYSADVSYIMAVQFLF